MISPRLTTSVRTALRASTPTTASTARLTFTRMASNNSGAPTEPVVLFESNLSSRTFKLNRPRPLNSLNDEMVTLLSEKIKAWKASDLCKVIIGTSTTDRGFCAGGDVKAVVEQAKAGNLREATQFFKDENTLDYELAILGKPYVVFMNGITMGGGAGLSYPASLRVATPSTEFAMPETKIGFAPDVGSQFYLAQLDGFVGAWLGITGQSVYGRAVYELGLATHYVPQRSLHDVISAIQSFEDPTLPRLAALINTYTAPPPSPEVASSPSTATSKDSHTNITGAIRELLDDAFSKPTIKEILSTLAKAARSKAESDPKTAEWAKEQIEIMRQRSPTGMKVALHNFRQARETRHLQTQLNNDLAMCTAFLTTSNTMDMVNGVSHVLMTKGAKRPMTWPIPADLYPGEPPAEDTSLPEPPKWSPDNLNDLSEDKVAKTWFDRERSPILKNAPNLDGFDANQSLLSSMRVDKLWGQFRAWGLPSEVIIKQFVEGSAKSSDAFALTEQELEQRLIANLCERMETSAESLGSGFSQSVRDQIKEIVKRKCEIIKEEKGPAYLRWKVRSSKL